MLDEALCDEAAFADGLGLLRVPAGLLEAGRPAHLRVAAVNRQRSTHWFRLGMPRLPFATYDVGAAFREIDRASTPVQLWRHLDTCGTPALTVPHHMSVAWFPLSLEHFHDPRYDRVAEIYSCWGDSLEHGRPVSSYADRVAELAFINAIRAGHRVGFIASSDSHDGNPGNSEGKPGHEQLFHHLGSARVAVLTATADRHGVFDALAARRCYALTGGRIVVEASLGGHPVGSELPRSAVGPAPTLQLAARSPVPLAELAVYRNGYRVDTLALAAGETRVEWTDERPPDAPAVSYFIKVTRSDDEMAWTSPIWVTARGPSIAQ